MREAVRRLRAAGLHVTARTLKNWIKERRLRDVLAIGPHWYIFEDEVAAMIGGRAPTPC